MKRALTTAGLGMVLGIPSTVIRGVVIAILWAWFVVPLSPAVIPNLHLAWAIGLSETITVLSPNWQADTSADGHTVFNALILSYAMPIVALVTGAIVHHWM